MDPARDSNARLLAGVQVLQAHTYTKFDQLQQEVETLAHQCKLSNGSLRLAIDMLPLIQNTIATNGAHFAPVWAAMHQNTNMNLINIRLDLEKMEHRMYKAMECTKEMRELIRALSHLIRNLKKSKALAPEVKETMRRKRGRSL